LPIKASKSPMTILLSVRHQSDKIGEYAQRGL
jgi:hypothetical protein